MPWVFLGVVSNAVKPPLSVKGAEKMGRVPRVTSTDLFARERTG